MAQWRHLLTEASAAAAAIASSPR